MREALGLASICASLPAFAAQTRRLKASLRFEVREVIDRHESQAQPDPVYRQAAMVYWVPSMWSSNRAFTSPWRRSRIAVAKSSSRPAAAPKAAGRTPPWLTERWRDTDSGDPTACDQVLDARTPCHSPSHLPM